MTIPVNIIKLLARWASDAIDGYLKDVPLEALTGLYRTAASSSSSSSGSLAIATTIPLIPLCDAVTVVGARAATAPPAPPSLSARDITGIVNKALTPLLSQLDSLRSTLSDMTVEADSCRHDIGMLNQRLLKPYICARSGYGAYHCVSADYNLTTPDTWSTRCGWKYGPYPFTRVNTIPENTPLERCCKRCLPEAVALELGIVDVNFGNVD